MAQVPDLKQTLLQCLGEHRRAGLGALPEAGHAEDDVVGLGVVTGPVAVGHHGAVAAEHVHHCGDLGGRGGGRSVR